MASLTRSTALWIAFNSSLCPIHCSPDNPEIGWFDDAKIICYRIAQFSPVLRDLFAQEPECRVSKLGAGRVAFVMRDVFVHDAPQALDRIEMRTIGRNEVQSDAAAWTFKPCAHEFGVMITRVVEKHMYERKHRIPCLDQFQQPDG